MTEPDNSSAGGVAAPLPGKLVGTTIAGRYQVEALLGEGGMGEVYRVEHILMRKRMALKVLRPEMTTVPEIVARFEREAMAAGHMDHPNVAAATDFGRIEDGSFFLVLEYIEGTNLRSIIDVGPIEAMRALSIVRQIGSALVRAHSLGIVHRDLKPENVMLVAREEHPDFVKVLDFGIAKVPLDSVAKPGELHSGKALTRIGTVFGTPEYMAPEQALGGNVDGRADIYSLGIVLYEMLTGSIPFSGDDVAAVLSKQITAAVPPFAERTPPVQVPSAVEAIVMRMLQKGIADRYADARELMDAIDTCMIAEGVMVGPTASIPSWTTRDGTAKTAMGLSAPVIVSSEGEGVAARRVTTAALVNHISKAWRQVTPWVTKQVERTKPLLDRWVEPALQRAAVRVPVLRRVSSFGVVAGLMGLVVVALMGVVLVVRGARKPALSVEVAPPAVVAAPLSVTDRPILQPLASDAIDKAAAQGSAALEALERLHPDDPRVVRALIRAFSDQKSYLLALRRVATLVQLEPKSADDPDLLQAVVQAAQSPEAVDEATGLLSTAFGEAGADALYELSTRALPNPIRTKLIQASVKPEVRAHASPALLVALDLRGAGSCESKRAILPRAQKLGDRRALPYLKPLSTSRGCGILGLGDCWSCLRRDPLLHDAVTAIEARH